MKTGLALIAGLFLAVSLAAQTQRVVVKVTKVDPPNAAKVVTLHLESGGTITVPEQDIDWSTSTATVPTGAPVTTSTAASRIRIKCAKDWPDDFRMRAVCERQQAESVTALQARTMTTADQRTIRAKCEKDWPDDYRMRNVCEEQQLKALATLR